MSEKNELEQQVVATNSAQKDRVGDLLRKERITRRIAVETIAKDLKLNVKYIKALEANEHESLPADPYVRVYLRSLAKYLSLDPDGILRKFYEDRGLPPEELQRDDSQKLEISIKDSEKHNPMLVVAIVLIVLLGLFTFIANRSGWLPGKTPSSAQTAAAIADSTSETDSAAGDSLLAEVPIQVPESAGTVALQSPKLDSLQFQIIATKDSVWVQVFADGQSWKNVMRKGQFRTFAALDSFNIHVGNNSHLKYTLGGKPLSVRGSGVTIFKLDRNGQTVWPMSTWNTVFKGRLN